MDRWTSCPRVGTDPYQVEHAEHKPLPPEPGSPPARPGSPLHSTRVELPGGRRITIAVDHDGCADRAVHYACKLLLRSPKDRVHLIHVQQKGHSQGAAVGAGAPLSQHGSAALPPLLSPLGSASEGGLSLSIPAGSRPSPGSPFASSAPARASVLYVPPVPPGASVSGEPIYPGSHTAGSPALTQFGSAGWLGLRSSGSSGGWSLTGLNRTSHQRDSQPQQQEGCSELMERCRQQLLASSKRTRSEHVDVHLLSAGKSQAKEIVKLCTQEGCDVLVMGSRGSNLRLLSLIGQGGGTTRYCQEHLPATRVVVLRPQW